MTQNVVAHEIEAARILGLKRQTLANWRGKMKGPKYVKLGGRIVYKISDLEDFLNRNTIDPEAGNGK
jgi:predicted DNA-binding transcriptional regulator AlpA